MDLWFLNSFQPIGEQFFEVEWEFGPYLLETWIADVELLTVYFETEVNGKKIQFPQMLYQHKSLPGKPDAKIAYLPNQSLKTGFEGLFVSVCSMTKKQSLPTHLEWFALYDPRQKSNTETHWR